VEGYIYLLSSHTKIVISDLDGTVTKSDVMGQLMMNMGLDYTHGGICELYNNIVQNGYLVMYLSSRSIVQYEDTRNYLSRI